MPFAVSVFGISISEVLRDLGYAGLALLMLAETVFPPIPSEAVLPLAGYLVEQGEFRYLTVVITATAGSVLGSVILYEAARHGGRPFADRFMRIGRLDPEKMATAEAWFAKRGPVVVLFGRFVPGVRSLVALPAGLLRMPRWEYLLFTVLGSAIWNAALVGAGWALGTQWEHVSDVIGPLSTPLLVAAVVGAGAWLTWRALHKRRAARTPA
jgi:membrane protein DedA with SNARE-associated domain